jgi:D-glycero-beta-D-manno-heptose 1-phosphate adenylyltransferase
MFQKTQRLQGYLKKSLVRLRTAMLGRGNALQSAISQPPSPTFGHPAHLLSSNAVAAGHQIRTPDKVLALDEAVDRVQELKRQGRIVVFTNGCFDLLHPGHTRYLAEARALGDVLVVAVNSDRTVRELKGPGRPVVPEEERAEVLAALRLVDYVTIFDDLTPREVIARMLPNVLVKGADWGPNEIVGREEVEAAGGQVVSIPLAEGYSTSAIIKKIKESGN